MTPPTGRLRLVADATSRHAQDLNPNRIFRARLVLVRFLDDAAAHLIGSANVRREHGSPEVRAERKGNILRPLNLN